MKTFILCLLAICNAAFADTNFYPVLKCYNRTYTNASLDSITPATVTVFWDGGGERIAITNLPDEVQTAVHYDPVAAEQYLADAERKKAAIKSSQRASAEAVAKAKATLGSNQIVQVVRSINGQEVYVLVQLSPAKKDFKIEKAYIHGLPSDVIAFIQDYTQTRDQVDASRAVNADARQGFDGPYRRATDLTAIAEDTLRARRHFTDLDAVAKWRTTVIARKSKYISASGLPQWEYVSTPAPGFNAE